MYCLKCKKVTATEAPRLVTTSNNRQLLKGTCKVCGKKKAEFQKKIHGSGLINKAIDKLPFEIHLPGYNYCGPGTKLRKRLERGDEGVNSLDQACKLHDVAYAASNETKQRHKADEKLASDASKIAFDPKSGFKEKLAAVGVAGVMKAKVKLGMGHEKKNPMDVLVDELHKPARRHFPRRTVDVYGLNDLWEADLVDMSAYSKQNKGFNFLLTVINVASKYAWAVPIRRKTGEDVSKAFASILRNGTSPPAHLHVDLGKEFYNAKVRGLLRKHDVKLYSTHSEKKASVVERLNRSLKSLMWKRFTRRGNYEWLDLLKPVLKEYNERYHRSIGMKPADVTEQDENKLKRVGLKAPVKRSKYKVGDPVRVSKVKGIFDKGYLQNWTNEILTVDKVQRTNPVTYLLKEHDGEAIKGSFYDQELQKTEVPDLFLIEKVVRKRKGGDGKMQYLVKWKGYENKYNTWVDDVSHL